MKTMRRKRRRGLPVFGVVFARMWLLNRAAVRSITLSAAGTRARARARAAASRRRSRCWCRRCGRSRSSAASIFCFSPILLGSDLLRHVLQQPLEVPFLVPFHQHVRRSED